uniref:C-type lectin domain-containing protein n=1 Tax=Poecilia reticulata TaxID=8081 RepID=A0A3P9Q2A0_POERE
LIYSANVEKKNTVMSSLPHLPSTPECPPVTPPVCSQGTLPECPPGWHTLKGSCYWVSCEQSTWFDARTRCESNGADLVIVNDETELV